MAKQTSFNRGGKIDSTNRAVPIFGAKKPGMYNAAKQSADLLEKRLKSYVSRKFILKVPKEIALENPDKKFFFINYKKWLDSGRFHPKGYRPFMLKDDHVDTKDYARGGTSDIQDNLVHRNEMILAYLPNEEWDELKAEEEAARLGRNETYESNFISKGDLRNFNPKASITLDTL